MKGRFWNTITRSNFFIRLRSWEYWPFGIVQFPLFFYWFYLSLKARSLLFFSASNPSIPMGGMFGESKYEVLKLIPEKYLPVTILIEAQSSTNQILALLQKHNLVFPLIFKPDIGERGFMVKRITNQKDIDTFINQFKKPFLAQELIDWPIEAGIFYRRYPNEENGEVTSVVLKEMLSVTGNGVKTLKELILEKDRAKLQWPALSITYQNDLHKVIPLNNKIELVMIGNHSLGTRFIDGCHLINDKLSISFDAISKSVQGFYFGRYDLKVKSIEDLYNGKIKIMELNGCGAEPAHIYDEQISLWKAMKIMKEHWKDMYTISKQNHKIGVPYLSLKQGISTYQAFKKAMK